MRISKCKVSFIPKQVPRTSDDDIFFLLTDECTRDILGFCEWLKCMVVF